MLTAVMLACVLAGCGGSDLSSWEPGGAEIVAKELKAEEEGNDSRRLNTIDTVVADMEKLNDFVFKGYENRSHGWYVGPGETHMGNNPNFRNSPFWSTFGNDSAYNGRSAKAMLPWLAVFDGVDHGAANVAVELRNVRAYVKSRSTGKWTLMGGPSKAHGSHFGKPGTGLGPRDEIVFDASDTGSSIRMGDDRRYFWHGWWNAGRKSINPSDIGAFFITVQARLVVVDSSKRDDRAKAELGLQVGADYYLETSTEYGGVAPAIGISRTKKITSEWQAFNYATLSDVGKQVPGGGITESELRAEPPPLE